MGRGVLLSPEGDVLAADPDWMPNALADQGELDILNDWLLGQATSAKYLALVSGTPSDTTTVATMTETTVAGTNGYARQQILTTDWAAPVLNAGDYQTTAAAKTFGPNTGASAWTISNAVLVTSATGLTSPATLFLVYIATTITSIPVGTSYVYTLTQKAQ
jgi:hypothetical protein